MSIESFYSILFVSPLYAAVDHGGAGGYPALMVPYMAWHQRGNETYGFDA
jgi:hypothetical protein